jgi:hypothetical protein
VFLAIWGTIFSPPSNYMANAIATFVPPTSEMCLYFQCPQEENETSWREALPVTIKKRKIIEIQ